MQSCPSLNILIAYPYFSAGTVGALANYPRERYRLIVDSGAFTAWRSGKPIELDDYCRFLDSIEHLRPFNAVQLDVFGDPAATWRNFLTMKARGYDVMPVFTRGDTVERLEEMYAAADYIMFGGITTGQNNRGYVNWFERMNTKRKAHWLGFTNLDYLKTYKPESVDTSSWRSAHRYGILRVYAGHGRNVVLHKKTFTIKPKEEHITLLRRVGATDDMIYALGKAQAWINNGKYKRGDITSAASWTMRLRRLKHSTWCGGQEDDAHRRHTRA